MHYQFHSSARVTSLTPDNSTVEQLLTGVIKNREAFSLLTCRVQFPTTMWMLNSLQTLQKKLCFCLLPQKGEAG